MDSFVGEHICQSLNLKIWVWSKIHFSNSAKKKRKSLYTIVILGRTSYCSLSQTLTASIEYRSSTNPSVWSFTNASKLQSCQFQAEISSLTTSTVLNNSVTFSNLLSETSPISKIYLRAIDQLKDVSGSGIINPPAILQS